MNQNVWCKLLGLHKYEVYKEEIFTDLKGNPIGKVIINRCSNCGKINKTRIFTEHGHER